MNIQSFSAFEAAPRLNTSENWSSYARPERHFDASRDSLFFESLPGVEVDGIPFAKDVSRINEIDHVLGMLEAEAESISSTSKRSMQAALPTSIKMALFHLLISPQCEAT